MIPSKKTQYKVLLLAAMLASLFLPGLSGQDAAAGAPSFGYLDLRNWDPVKDGPVSLDRSWGFLWQRFIGPETLAEQGQELAKQARPIRPPPRWTEKIEGFEDLPTFGYGTYFLTVLLPENRPQLGLRLGPIGASARILWKSAERAPGEEKIGEPAARESDYRPEMRGSLIPLFDSGARLDLAIQVANFDDLNSGIHLSPLLGTYESLRGLWERDLAVSAFVSGLLFILALYHFALFLFRREVLTALWFGFLCLFLSLRVPATDEMFLYLFFPDLPLKVVFLFSYLSYSLSVISLGFVVTSLFPSRFGTIVNALNLTGSGLYSLIVVLSKASVFTLNLVWFQGFSVFIGLLLTILLVGAVYRKKPHSLLFFLALALVIATALHDILKSRFLFPTPSLAPYGVIATVFILALVITRLMTRAISVEEKANRDLSKNNRALQKFLPPDFLTHFDLDYSKVSGLDLGAHRARTLTVLSAELKNYDLLTEGFKNDEKIALLDRFFAHAGPFVRKYGGYVHEYQGKGVLAVFPQIRDAIDSASELVKSLEALNSQKLGINGSLELGIGLHQGEVLLAAIGEEDHRNAALLTEAVKTAERLRNLCPSLGASLLVNERTLELLTILGEYHYRYLGKFRISGRDGSKTMEIYDLFDADGSTIWNLKRKTKREFERAVYLYLEGRKEEAAKVFSGVLEDYPNDATSLYYLRQMTRQAD